MKGEMGGRFSSIIPRRRQWGEGVSILFDDISSPSTMRDEFRIVDRAGRRRFPFYARKTEIDAEIVVFRS
jgi:hypothetical protein